jgi:hypothetical protein
MLSAFEFPMDALPHALLVTLLVHTLASAHQIEL